MIDDRFPKDRGPRDHTGHAAVRTIAQDDQFTWLRKRRFGAEARNKGGYLTAQGAQNALDGFYSIGDLIGGDVTVFGDSDARGVFSQRGPFMSSTGLTFNQTAVLPRFDGWGQTLAAERLGYVENKQGIGCPLFLMTEYKTYNGLKYESMYGFYFTRATYDIGNEAINGVFHVTPSRHGPPDAQLRESIGVSGVVMVEGGDFTPFYIRDRYGDDQELIFTPCTEDQYVWDHQVIRLNPTTLVGRVTYMRSEYPVDQAGVPIPNRYNNSECPGYEFRFSYDNGTTWVDASSAQLFQEFDDTVLTLEPEDPETGSQETNDNARFNSCINYIITQFAPISATKAIVYALVPYMDGATLRGKVKIGMCDSAARTITEVQTLMDDTLDEAWYYMGSQACEPTEGGALIVTAPHAPGVSRWRDQPRFGFTPDGVSFAWAPTYPTEGMNIGFFRGFSPREMGMVQYVPGTGFVLMSSKDRGVTWQQRALVSGNGVPPNDFNQQPYLVNFAAVSQLREQGVGANPQPDAPWICDSKLVPPIL